jgi:antitoxin component YwqK of YwqJK toxin-antitoxin module
MNKTHNLPFLRSTLFLTVSVVLIFSITPLQAQPSTAVEQIKTAIQQNIDHLDAGWDEASYIMPINSSAYLKARTSSNKISNSLGIYSFKGNVKDAPSQRLADQRLKTLALLLRKATDEITDMYEQGTYEGELKQLKPLLKFIGFTVSNKPLSLSKLDVRHSKVQSLTPRMLEHSTFRAEALTQEAEMLASSQWMAMNKHLAYKFLTAYILTVPMFWAYLEPEFFRLVSEGGASTDIIVYVKLHMNREPFILQDSRIWNKAPRFQASQLQLVEADAGSQTRHIKNVELSDTETRVTLRYNVGGREMWYRFDNTLALVDNETKELYPIRRIENSIPLGKTFIVVGCEGKAVEFTFVFPPLKKTLKQFVLDDNLSAPTSEKAKMRYFKKHNIMSDGSGRSPVVIYNLSEFVATGTDKPDALATKPVQSTTTTRVTTSVPPATNARVTTPVQSTSVITPLKDESVVYKRVVKEPRSNGQTAEWTYVDDKLVDGKIYFPSGKLEEQYNYINGIREGDSYQYYETGEVHKIWTYKNGHRISSTGYFVTGEIRYKYGYKNGIQDGITYEYDRNGTLIKEWSYVNGKKEGKSVEYVSKAKRAEWTYLSGELISGIIYYPSGKQQELINFTKGVRDGEAFTYYETGELKKKTTYDNGKITAGVMYYETGEIKTTYSYKNGVMDGPTVSYSKSGKVTQETMLKDGYTHGTNKLYYENGNLRLVQNMANGKQNGERIEYDINGKVIRKEMYQDNKLVK